MRYCHGAGKSFGQLELSSTRSQFVWMAWNFLCERRDLRHTGTRWCTTDLRTLLGSLRVRTVQKPDEASPTDDAIRAVVSIWVNPNLTVPVYVITATPSGLIFA